MAQMKQKAGDKFVQIKTESDRLQAQLRQELEAEREGTAAERQTAADTLRQTQEECAATQQAAHAEAAQLAAQHEALHEEWRAKHSSSEASLQERRAECEALRTDAAQLSEQASVAKAGEEAARQELQQLPVLRLFPPCALISHAQGSSGVVEKNAVCMARPYKEPHHSGQAEP